MSATKKPVATALGTIKQRRQEAERRAKETQKEERALVERYVDDLLRRPRAELVREVLGNLDAFLEMKPLPQDLGDRFIRDVIIAVQSEADNGQSDVVDGSDASSDAVGQDGKDAGGGSEAGGPVLPLRRNSRAAAATAAD